MWSNTYFTIVQLVKAPVNDHLLSGFRKLFQGLTGITTANKNPWGFVRRQLVTVWLWQHDILRKVFQIINGLLDGMKF